MNDKISRVSIRRHSGMDAGIQRPWMAIFGFLRAMGNANSSPPCDWIPAIPAGMTGYRLLQRFQHRIVTSKNFAIENSRLDQWHGVLSIIFIVTIRI